MDTPEKKLLRGSPAGGLSLSPWRVWLEPNETTLEKHRPGVAKVDRLVYISK